MKLNKIFLVFLMSVCFAKLHFAENNPKGSDRIFIQTSYENSNHLLMQYHLANYSMLTGEFSDEQDKNDAEEEKVSRKSPWLSFFLSLFLPTSGQIYNGDYTKALIQAGLILGGGGLVTTMTCVECGDYGTAQTALLITGIGMAFSGYIWSIIDAPASANEINDRNRQNAGLNIFNSENHTYSLKLNRIPITNSYTISLAVNF
jgi:hypothetical protein